MDGSIESPGGRPVADQAVTDVVDDESETARVVGSMAVPVTSVTPCGAARVTVLVTVHVKVLVAANPASSVAVITTG